MCSSILTFDFSWLWVTMASVAMKRSLRWLYGQS